MDLKKTLLKAFLYTPDDAYYGDSYGLEDFEVFLKFCENPTRDACRRLTKDTDEVWSLVREKLWTGKDSILLELIKRMEVPATTESAHTEPYTSRSAADCGPKADDSAIPSHPASPEETDETIVAKYVAVMAKNTALDLIRGQKRESERAPVSARWLQHPPSSKDFEELGWLEEVLDRIEAGDRRRLIVFDLSFYWIRNPLSDDKLDYLYIHNKFREKKCEMRFGMQDMEDLIERRFLIKAHLEHPLSTKFIASLMGETKANIDQIRFRLLRDLRKILVDRRHAWDDIN